MRKSAFSFFAACSFVVGTVSATPLYKIKDLTPAGYTGSTAYDINNDGDVVGVASRFVAGTRESAYFFYDGATKTSSVFGVGLASPRDSAFGPGFRAVSLNDSGTVAGTAVLTGAGLHARAFTSDTSSFTNLGVFPVLFDRAVSEGADINNSGVTVGTASAGAGTYADAFSHSAGATSILDFDGDATAASGSDRARAINSSGTIVGSNEAVKAVRFSGASETLILAGSALGADTSTATDINDDGFIIGHTGSNASFLYNPDTLAITVLPNLGTGGRVLAKALNSSKQIVGWADKSAGLSGQGRGFVYTGGTMYALEEHIVDLDNEVTPELAGWIELRTAWGINDDGSIVGVGSRRFGAASFPTERAYLLQPVPVPGAAILFFSALIGLGRARIPGR